jgi:AmpE protein
MAIVLVATLLVLLVCRGVPDLARLRNFAWWQAWVARVESSSPASALVLGVGVPVLICALIQCALRGNLFGLSSFVFAVAILFYCWGPRDLEQDAEAVAKAPDSERRIAAAQALRPDGQEAELPFEPEALVAATFAAALKRWFGVLFWFALAGPAGALMYRLTQLLAHSPEVSGRSSSSLAQRAAMILDWLPAHLMALALALGSNFDAVFKTWRDWHATHNDKFDLDPGFLDAIARASVDADIASNGDENGAHEPPSPLVALEDAMVLVRRVLVVWLMVIALIVLAGWFG